MPTQPTEAAKIAGDEDVGALPVTRVGSRWQRARSMTKEAFRLWQMWIATIVLMGAVYFLAPQQLGISIYKASLITTGALIGFWVDKWSFPSIRWEDTGVEKRHGMYRRAALMAAGMLAFGLGA